MLAIHGVWASYGSLKQAVQDRGGGVGRDAQVVHGDLQIVEVVDWHTVADGSSSPGIVGVIVVVLILPVILLLPVVVDAGVLGANEILYRRRCLRVHLFAAQPLTVCREVSNCGRCLGGERDGKALSRPRIAVIRGRGTIAAHGTHCHWDTYYKVSHDDAIYTRENRNLSL